MTKYSPLYIAAYNGHKEGVEILVNRYERTKRLKEINGMNKSNLNFLTDSPN